MKRIASLAALLALSLSFGSTVSAQKYTDIFQFIRGQVPGVIVGNASPGEMPNIIIRGIGTNSAQTQPLFLIDNVITPNIASLDPENVYSIEVLKDAASTAIYGMEGANGVIMITTKGAAQAALDEAARKKAERKAKRTRQTFEALRSMEKAKADSVARAGGDE